MLTVAATVAVITRTNTTGAISLCMKASKLRSRTMFMMWVQLKEGMTFSTRPCARLWNLSADNGGRKFLTAMDPDTLSYQPLTDPTLPDDDAGEFERGCWKLQIVVSRRSKLCKKKSVNKSLPSSRDNVHLPW